MVIAPRPVRLLARAASDLVLPNWCPGCGRPGRVLCCDCEREFRHWFRADVDAANLATLGLPTWSAAGYHGPVRRIVMSWKSGSRPDLAEPMARIGRGLGTRLGRTLAVPVAPGPLAVVPAPSGWRRRWRGREVVEPWARAVAAGLAAELGTDVPVTVLLARTGGRSHHLGAAARRDERERAIGRRRGATAEPAAGYVLVDDVVTTGATLAAAATALGGAALAAVTLAATPAPRRRLEV
ncbi:ComF family protein [Pseudactinotalea sp. HY158]|uniref:ComF family protein n=1 Tax=Pseudactinotalea sp. HY158 TaxID=2654547 RepID=UPI00129C400C|nr:ComF family protein [Pseudactinotalea sp. HY158]QGH68856.1 ComF family protein [Pseudactinotalea sp. HY158]